MSKHSYYPHGVCSQQIFFELDTQNRLHNVSFTGGCNGNLKALGILVEGQEAEKIVLLLKHNDCGGRGTSCADQLARAIEEALAKNAKNS
jgi:uncharacterized protein (TIGR03905 family)